MDKPLFSVWLPGEPIGKGRPRATRQGRIYTPAATRAWEERSAKVMRSRWGYLPLEAPCEARVYAYHTRPATRPRAVPAPLWATGCACPRPSKPDVDNIVKAVLDAATQAGVLGDDRFVTRLVAETRYAAAGEEPGVRLEIYPLAAMEAAAHGQGTHPTSQSPRGAYLPGHREQPTPAQTRLGEAGSDAGDDDASTRDAHGRGGR